MRSSPWRPRRSVTVWLLLINLAVFLTTLGLQDILHLPANKYLALSLDGLKHGFVWQLLSYQFMHANFVHLFFNCWAIYLFGPDVEEAVGRNAYIALYLLSGTLGGLLQIAAGAFISPVYGFSVVGASAAAFGLCAAFGLLFPDRIIYLFFVLPVRAKYISIVSGILALVGAIRPQGNVADVAHVGGWITGMLFVRYASQWEWRLPSLRRSSRQAPRRLVKVTTIKGGLWGKTKPGTEEDLPPQEFLSKEVDPILDKISAHGIQSLTERERRILEAARQKMGKR